MKCMNLQPNDYIIFRLFDSFIELLDVRPIIVTLNDALSHLRCLKRRRLLVEQVNLVNKLHSFTYEILS